jgi:hypothetical protein
VTLSLQLCHTRRRCLRRTAAIRTAPLRVRGQYAHFAVLSLVPLLLDILLFFDVQEEVRCARVAAGAPLFQVAQQQLALLLGLEGAYLGGLQAGMEKNPGFFFKPSPVSF